MFLALGEASTYSPIAQSRQFPRLTVTEANRQLDAFRTIGRLEWMRSVPPPRPRRIGPSTSGAPDWP